MQIGWIITAIIILLLIVTYIIFRNSPFGQALGDLFGAVETALEGISAQLDTCFKSGFFSAECPYGFLGIGALIFTILAKLTNFFGLRGLFRNSNSDEFRRAYGRDFTGDDLEQIKADAESWTDEWIKKGNGSVEERPEILKAVTELRGIAQIQVKLKAGGKQVGKSAKNATEARDRYEKGSIEAEAIDDAGKDWDVDFE